MREQDEEISDEGWDVRETYAFFGLAFYQASVLEVGLAHALMWSDFLTKVGTEYRLSRGKGFNRGEYEASFDAFVEQQFSQTMGNILRRIDSVDGLSDDLKTRIRKAKERRDFLAHHYWRERSVQFATQGGRAEMREELKNDADLFQALDREVNAALKPTRASLGVKDEVLEAHTKKMMDRIKAGLPPDDEVPTEG